MVKTEDITIDQCVQALQWMVAADYTLSVHGSLLNQLVAKCTKNDLESLRFIHSLITRQCIATEEDDVIIKTVLLNAYGLCGDVDSALDIFHSLKPSECGNAPIGAMMKVYVGNSRFSEAFSFYDQHQGDGNDVLHRLALKCCIKSNAFERGRELHSKLSGNENIFIKTALIGLYSHFGDVRTSQEIFDSVPDSEQNVYSINTMIAALVHNEDVDGAMAMMDRYRQSLDEYSYSFLVKWSVDHNRYDIGLRVIDSMPSSMSMRSVSLHRNLMEFYGAFGDVASVLTLYRSLKSSKNMKMNRHSLNVVLSALTHNGYHRRCLELYAEHQSMVDVVSHGVAIKACIATEDKAKGYQVMERMENGDDESVQSKNGRIECYGHFGDVDAAMEIFKSIESAQRDRQSVCAMMGAFIKNERYRDALALYDGYWKLHDDICHVLALKACGQLMDFEKGTHILRGHRLRESDNLQIQNSLITFYGHCRVVDSALTVFHGMETKDVVTVNAMMDAFRHCNRHRDCIELFVVSIVFALRCFSTSKMQNCVTWSLEV